MTLIGQPVDAGSAEPDTDFAGIAGSYLTDLQALIRDLDVAAIERIVRCCAKRATLGVSCSSPATAGAPRRRRTGPTTSARPRVGRAAPSRVMGCPTTSRGSPPRQRRGLRPGVLRPARELRRPGRRARGDLRQRQLPEPDRGRGARARAAGSRDGAARIRRRGKLKDMVDECLWLPTEPGQYGLVESGHTVALRHPDHLPDEGLAAPERDCPADSTGHEPRRPSVPPRR